MIELQANEIIAIVAIIVASVSAFSVAYQTILLRKHHRLSVKPHITQTYGGKGFDGCVEATWQARNDGIGPAIIKKYAIFYEKQKIASSVDSVDRSAISESVKKKINGLNKKIIEFGAQNIIKKIQNSVNVFAEGSYFPANDNEILLQITVINNPSLNPRFVEDFIKRFELLFVYEDMYGAKFKNFEKIKKKWWERLPFNRSFYKIPDTLVDIRII